MKKLRYAYAEPEDKKDDKQNEEILNQILQSIKSQEDRFTKIEEENKSLKALIDEMSKKKEEPRENKEEKKDTKEKDEEPTKNPEMEEYLKQMKIHNQMVLDGRKKEIAKKYGIDEKELEVYNTLESLNTFDVIYSKGYSLGKEKALDEKNLTEVLKKKKQMIIAIDDHIGNKEEQRLKHEEQTKKIFAFFNKK